MKRIIIICEGQTEQEFCKKVLMDPFSAKQITIQPPTIKKSGGGIVSWNVLKKEVEIHLKKDRTAIVTPLIDYYGIHEKLGFPGWAKAQLVVDKIERMDYLESCMRSVDHPTRVSLDYFFIRKA